jgi:hypothetical protein
MNRIVQADPTFARISIDLRFTSCLVTLFNSLVEPSSTNRRFFR